MEERVGKAEGGKRKMCIYYRRKIHKNYLNSIGFIFYRRKFMMKCITRKGDSGRWKGRMKGSGANRNIKKIYSIFPRLRNNS